jgi:L-lactate dehydrogenase complex protein LldG
MSAGRETVLAAIRAATGDVPEQEPPAYGWVPPADTPPDLDLLAERLAHHGAIVTRLSDGGAVRDAIAVALARHQATRVAIDPGLSADLRPDGAELLVDDPPVDNRTLSAVPSVLTTASLAIAQTGTIVLDHRPGQGRRALTLLPDLHLCVVTADQVRQTVPAAIADLAPGRPITFISGPSATSDIELDRVEGVHGPRRLEVLLVGTPG